MNLTSHSGAHFAATRRPPVTTTKATTAIAITPIFSNRLMLYSSPLPRIPKTRNPLSRDNTRRISKHNQQHPQRGKSRLIQGGHVPE